MSTLLKPLASIPNANHTEDGEGYFDVELQDFHMLPYTIFT